MESFDQIPFSAAEFADNPEPRCPCILLLDTSGSMAGAAIRELNAGLKVFQEELNADTLAMKRVEVAIVTFGPVTLVNDFETPDRFVPPTLTASGDTPIGGAIERALDILEQRKELYRHNGVSYYRPWIFLITDGSPTDSYHDAAAKVRESVASKRLAFFSVAVEGADMTKLSEISVGEPLHLKGLSFREMFRWLSSSLRSVSRSNPTDAVPLENPTAPDGWAFV
jgi:uncharacterized protein YegL